MMGTLQGSVGKMGSIHYSIILQRVGEGPVELGTAPTYDAVEGWFSGAYRMGLLPDPPKYTDEIQVVEVGENGERELKWVWRVAWMQFTARLEAGR